MQPFGNSADSDSNANLSAANAAMSHTPRQCMDAPMSPNGLGSDMPALNMPSAAHPSTAQPIAQLSPHVPHHHDHVPHHANHFHPSTVRVQEKRIAKPVPDMRRTNSVNVTSLLEPHLSPAHSPNVSRPTSPDAVVKTTQDGEGKDPMSPTSDDDEIDRRLTFRQSNHTIQRSSTKANQNLFGDTGAGIMEWVKDKQMYEEAILALAQNNRIAALVLSSRFDAAFTILIIINAIYIGIETDNNLDSDSAAGGWFAGEIVFTLLFSVELGLRLLGLRLYFFRDAWNLFDFVLVVVGVIDTFILSIIRSVQTSEGKQDNSLDVFMAMRVVRLLRLARIFRLLRFFKELWLLVAGVLNALRTLMWTWMFVLLIIYIFGLVATRMLGQEYGDKDPNMREYFGTVSASMFTFFQVVTLEGWSDVARESMDHEPSMWILFILFISITTFAIMNVVTAVIVENTLDQAMLQKGDISKKLDKERLKALTKLYEVFQVADLNGDGELTKDEFLSALSNPDVMINLHAVEIDLRSAEGLFDIMDYDDSGHLDVTEFIEGCMRARGDAKAKDVLAVQCDLWRTQEWVKMELEQTNDFVMSKFGGLKQDLARVKEKVLSPEFQSRFAEMKRKVHSK